MHKVVRVRSDGDTVVKRVSVGTPVRVVSRDVISINNIAGINTENRTDGSVLVYNDLTKDWEATLDLEEQNINGGNY